MQSTLPTAFAVVLALGFGTGCVAGDESGGAVKIFAAASTTDAINAALAKLSADGGPDAVAIVGSSSSMARQIENGAPADLFLSANTAWMDHLAKDGRVGVETRVDLLGNDLVLIGPASDARPVDLTQGVDLMVRLGDGRLAVGDPDHVPAGQYAKQALQWTQSWDAVEPRLARAADVRAAMALVQRGEAPLGIVYSTDAAASSDLSVVGRFPAESHPPILYPLAIVRGQGEREGVVQVWEYLQSDDARAIFAEHGFRRP